MKSPTISTIIIAVVFAIISFFVFYVFPSIQVTPVIIAVCVFVSAFFAPLLCSPNSAVPSDLSSASSDIKTLYVGNLPYRANEAAVKELFENYGHVESVRLMKDKHTGKRRGFGFVEMAATDLDKAITELNDVEFQQRTLKVREAKERPERIE